MKSLKVSAVKCAIICFLALIVFNLSCSPKMAQKDKERVESMQPVKDSELLRVMSYNIHHCNPPSRPGFIDVDAIVKVIRMQDPDLLALQEVDVNTDRSGKYNQAGEIAQRLDMHFFFGKAIDYGGGEYGVAILSKFSLSEQTIHRLPTKAETKGEPRILATAKVSLPDGSFIRFGSTHLDAQKNPVNRELQIQEIAKHAGREPLPFIIAGDFNAIPGSGVISLLDSSFQRTCQACDPTIPEKNPTRAIDFIAFTPRVEFSVLENKVVDEQYASDHRPVVAIIKRNTVR